MNKKSRKYLEATVVADTKNMSNEEWLKARQMGIGGSDASAVVGCNPWKSAVQVYIEKKEENPKQEEAFRMKLGHKLEQTVADLFMEETGLKVKNVNGILQNEKYPFAMANIDRAVVGEKAFLECKTTNSFAAKEWECDMVPVHYAMQCLHYMAVTGATHCYIAVLIGNQDFKWQKLERDEILINNLMELEREFWENNILKDELPVADGSDAFSRYIAERYNREEKGKTIDLNYMDNIRDYLQRRDEIDNEMKALKEEKNLIDQSIQLEMKEAEKATAGDRMITWKSQNRTSIDTKRLKSELPEIAEKYSKISTYRTFKVK